MKTPSAKAYVAPMIGSQKNTPYQFTGDP
jgi:hypothetical protein